MTFDVGPEVVLTVGHGGRTIADLVDLLGLHQRRYLIDVRSSPYSRFAPEFSRGPLERQIQDVGVTYVFMGDQLGGRPDDPAAYDSAGHVDYRALAALPAFQVGLSRLARASGEGHAIVLLCSELLPERCHRSKLIGVELEKRDVPVVHIGRDGGTLRQRDVMRSLEGPQLSLLPDEAPQRSRNAYRG